MSPEISWIFDPSAWVGLVALSILQVLLGVDNIVLITILARGLPKEKREMGRRLGVFVAMISRLLLLSIIFVVAKFAEPFTEFHGMPVSVRSILLLVGGLFLVYKATKEMYSDMELKAHVPGKKGKAHSMMIILLEIFFLDVLFSFDQVLAAIGMSPILVIQVVSVLVSVVVMAVFVNQLAKLLEAHPSLRMIALSFLILVGMSLIAEGTDHPIPHGYLYFAMAYAMGVELINIRRRSKVRMVNASLPAGQKVDEHVSHEEHVHDHAGNDRAHSDHSSGSHVAHKTTHIETTDHERAKLSEAGEANEGKPATSHDAGKSKD